MAVRPANSFFPPDYGTVYDDALSPPYEVVTATAVANVVKAQAPGDVVAKYLGLPPPSRPLASQPPPLTRAEAMEAATYAADLEMAMELSLHDSLPKPSAAATAPKTAAPPPVETFYVPHTFASASASGASSAARATGWPKTQTPHCSSSDSKDTKDVKSPSKKVLTGCTATAAAGTTPKVDYNAPGAVIPDHTERDLKALMSSRVFAEERAKNQPTWDKTMVIPDDTSWITDNAITCGVIHQVDCSRKKGIPVKWPEGYHIRVNYAWNTALFETTVNRAESKFVHNITSVSNKVTFIPMGIGPMRGGVMTTNHWIMVVIDSIRRLITYWDPMSTDIPAGFKATLKKHFPSFVLHVCREYLQTDSFQCGVYVIYGCAVYYYDLAMRKPTQDGMYRFSPTRSPLNVGEGGSALMIDMRSVLDSSKYLEVSKNNDGLIKKYRHKISKRMKESFEKQELTDMHIYST